MSSTFQSGSPMTYIQWTEACAGHGWDGPYKIINQNCHQYVSKRTGTAAVYNHDQGCGYIFEHTGIPNYG